ncbi:MAG: hypothetical protein NTW19_18575 [Planctomycetota bacterium]|nr:hypothetical protein [Planctomycetota bacterium]
MSITSPDLICVLALGARALTWTPPMSISFCTRVLLSPLRRLCR